VFNAPTAVEWFRLARQVRGDRRRLRDDGERRITPDLVSPARGRVGYGGGQPQQHRAQAVVERAAGLQRTGQEEAARTVVQQRRIARPQRLRDEGIGLVPCRADRVVPLAALAHPACLDVE
jgi:hypothetical protein